MPADAGAAIHGVAASSGHGAIGRILPKAAGRVFFKREVMGAETDEICKEEGITSSNCWVMLHRARVALRECLEWNWFMGAAK
ncbi:MAG TPA: sigma factor-like helix-turn-helix DNA-binding protein [Usitatibacteraceae bacterium]